MSCAHDHKDNILRLCFEPFRINNSDLLEGLGSEEYLFGGKQIVNGIKMYFCKLDEIDGLDGKKTAKSCEIKIKFPDWVKETEGSCTFSTKKPSDLERHLLGVHSLKFKEYAFHCTHCENTHTIGR